MFNSSNDLWNFKNEVKHSRRYIYTKEVQHFLDEFRLKLKDYEAEIKKDAVFCRSQKGHGWKKIHEEIDDLIETAFEPDRMKPIMDKALEGRINPKGIPYLYLSNDIDTAIAESRPWIGEKISIGMFEIQRDIRLVHFTDQKKSSIVYLKGVPKEKYDEVVWSDINNSFSEPINNQDNTADYIPTQVLSEIIKDEGYDGIIYSSRVGSGVNIVLFELEDAKIVSCALYNVNKITIDQDQIENPYFITEMIHNEQLK